LGHLVADSQSEYCTHAEDLADFDFAARIVPTSWSA